MPPSDQRRRLGFGFGRAKRLCGSHEFARLKAEGERRACGGLLLNWHRSGVGTEVRLGLVTSRRVGGAVVRSRVRRLIREAFRLNQHQISGPVRLVLVARSSIVGKSLPMVERDLRRCLREAGLWIEIERDATGKG
ncbi:MAG: ribonuclease P protein component [Limisphaerales bacterium]